MTATGPPGAAPGTATALEDRPVVADDAVRDVVGGTDQDRSRGLDARPGLAVVIVVAAYGLSRGVAAIAGVRFDDSVLRGTQATDMWQLLDLGQLRDHLAVSVWHLSMQPPLFNLYVGLLLNLPDGLRGPTEVVGALALGLLLAVCTYLLMVELRVPRVAALVVTLVGVVASPAYLLYENWLDYAYPTAALGTFAAWSLIRFLRTRRFRYGIGFFSGYAAVVLLNSSYQIEWLLVAAVPVVVVLRTEWRTVVAVAALPVFVVAGWYVKDYVQVGTTTTSSWLGMNLARSVLFRAPADQIAELQRQGRMNAVASVPPFAKPTDYTPTYVHARPDPVAAVGALTKSDGSPNYNNPLYVAVSSQYLHDDLAWIRAHPAAYADDVTGALGVWFVGTDQNFTNSVDWPTVRAYARFYDRAVEWQPTQDPAPAFALFARGWHRPQWLSVQAMAAYALALVGAPVLAWRRRRSDPALAGTVAVLWWTTAYALTTSSLFEIGENERFRSELGPVPLVLAVVVVTAVVRGVWSRRARTGRGVTSSAE